MEKQKESNSVENNKAIKDTIAETTKRIKKEVESGTVDLAAVAKRLKIAPSKQAILQMPYDILIKHNALIFHKGSSLSSAQRKMVKERVAYGIKRGLIKPSQMSDEINKLNALIRGELVKNLRDDDSINK